MKKVILTLLAVFTVGVNANALSVHRSREEARFLTDKMVYELNLTDDQADDVYEINYDYFRALGPIDGIYSHIINRRYEDLSYVLYDWQWEYFLNCDYFVYPAYIYRGGWAFGIYNYYARTHFFYGIPRLYYHYNGGHFHHPNYYRGRFNMHRRAIARLPRPAHRIDGHINHGRINHGNHNHGNMNHGNNNHGSMNRGGNNHGNMNPGGNNHGSMNRGGNNHGSMNPGNNNHGSMNPGNNNHGSMNPGNNNHGGMNPGNNNHGGMNRGNNNHGSMNRGGNFSNMNRGATRGGSSPSRISRSHNDSHRSSTAQGSRSHGNRNR